MNNSGIWMAIGAGTAALIWSVGAGAQIPAGSKTITEADCIAAKLGDGIPVSAIGEPVGAVTLSDPRWNTASKGGGPYCMVNGSIAPVDKAPTARPINFAVAFPSDWNGRSVQLGGGGMNGTIPGLAGAQEKLETLAKTLTDSVMQEERVAIAGFENQAIQTLQRSVSEVGRAVDQRSEATSSESLPAVGGSDVSSFPPSSSSSTESLDERWAAWQAKQKPTNPMPVIGLFVLAALVFGVLALAGM